MTRRETRSGPRTDGPADARSARGRALRTALLALGAGLFAARGCTPAEDSRAEPRHVMVVGVDVSGSFRAGGRFGEALDFLAHYIHGHLNAADGLHRPTSLFVGPVGGDRPGEAQGFHPIHDFRGKTPDEIAGDLRSWFGGEDRLTDFNAFFRRVGELTRKRGLALSPMSIVILTDGKPDMRLAKADSAADGAPASAAAAAAAGPDPGASAGAASADDAYRAIDLDPLEYLSHSVTVRLLYPEPPVAAAWERNVERNRVRVWTADATVMGGWRAQLDAGRSPDDRSALWSWIRDNVDHPVRGRLF